jgi:DNA-binding transcriptional LysR family regulator
MDRAPDWDLYRSFLAVLDEGSLSAGARILHLAQPTLGRHIEALEAALGGQALFTRSPSGLRPTAIALALAPHARSMASAADALARTAAGAADETKGAIRLTTSETMGEVLAPVLAAHRAAWPGVALEVLLTNRMEDLLHRDVDIAVRMARPTQGALFARKVGVTRTGLYAHKAYLARHGIPKTMAELRFHTVIGYDRTPILPQAQEHLDAPVTRETFGIRTDSEFGQLALLRAGAGISGLHLARAPREPDLVPVLHDQFTFGLEVWVAMHEDLKSDRRMRALFDRLVSSLTDYIDGKDLAAA